MRLPSTGFWPAFTFCLAVFSCAVERTPEEDEGCLTSLDCAEGLVCADSRCADPSQGTGGTESLVTDCSAGIEPSGEGGAGGEGPSPDFEECEAQCEEAKTCEEAEQLFDCRANCFRSIDQVKVSGCTSEWDDVVRCSDECGVCDLCVQQLSALHVCFVKHCRAEPDSPICMDTDTDTEQQ